VMALVLHTWWVTRMNVGSNRVRRFCCGMSLVGDLCVSAARAAVAGMRLGCGWWVKFP
jgi:hypothetical protein